LVCLDTDLLVGLLRGDPKAADVIRRLESERRTPTTTAVNAYELLKGGQISSNPAKNIDAVKRLLASLRVLPLTDRSCWQSAEIYADLRARGKLSGEFDVLIAGIVAESREVLVSRDEHFSAMKGIRVQYW
jgi:tRNA(fMet)-specific endonuclease VapC